MTRPASLLVSALSLLALWPAPVDAQVRVRRGASIERDEGSARTTRGRTRRARRARGAGSANGVRVRSGSADRNGNGWRRRRRRRVRVMPGVVYDGCDFYEGGYCVRDSWEYYGESWVGLGFSVGVFGGLLPSDLNGLSSARVVGPDLSAGLLPTYGIDARGWLAYARLRLGVAVQAGGGSAPSGIDVSDAGVFEEGSRVGDGWQTGVWGIGAYQPQLSDLVQLWIGARVGYHGVGFPVRSNGRAYASVGRDFFSAGPELGLRLSADTIGVMLWGFADLAQPGAAQLVLAFVFEEPKPTGAAF